MALYAGVLCCAGTKRQYRLKTSERSQVTCKNCLMQIEKGWLEILTDPEFSAFERKEAL